MRLGKLWLERLITYARFVKIEHTLFSFPLLLSGALLARDRPLTLRTFLLILCAGVGARTAALALNRVLDRAIDRANPRTAGRELARGVMTPAEGWLVIAIGTIVYAVAAYLVSPLCLLLAPIPLLVFTVYPLLKRITAWAHLGVGLGLSLAPLGAWFAVSLSFRDFGPALLLGLFTFFWVSGFDIIYSTLDEDHDRAAGLHSLPARLGRRKALSISLGLHLAAFLCLGALYLVELEGIASGLLLLMAGGLLYLEHRKAEDVELAFFKINAVLGFVILAFIYTGLVRTT
jgi:4-hydroxybenzoate polyprenyltransferase